MLGEIKRCYNCFQTLEGEGPCPYCGFDKAQMEGKYPAALPYGTVLGGKYVVGRVLGQGGFGITYKAFDPILELTVAVKEYLPDTMATRSLSTTQVTIYTGTTQDNFKYGVSCFLDEARTLAKLSNGKSMVPVRSFFEENGTAYFVMDYVEGISFKAYIQNHGGKVSLQDALRVMLPVIESLAQVHQSGIIHRDVTPDNIYITKNDDIKLLDFGSARYSMGDKSKSLDVILKPGFAPKEQYMRRGRQGPYTDVYSVAACIYAAVTGYIPPESLERGKDSRIYAQVNTIGRSELNDICLKGDVTISGTNHAKLSYSEQSNSFFLTPADNKNIILLNGKEVFGTEKLSPYDVLHFGVSRFLFLPLCGEKFIWEKEDHGQGQ